MVSSAPSSRALDLASLGQDLREAWRRLQRSRALAALTPALPVRLLHADGTESAWIVDAGGAQPASAPSPSGAFVALELPEDDVLFRSLALPMLGEAEVRQAVALDVAGANPFAPDDLVWSYTTRAQRDGMQQALVAIASRRQIARFLERSGARLPAGAVPEVWALQRPMPPVVLPGFGERLRAARAQRGGRLAAGLVALAAVLLVAIAVTPTAQLRLRAIEAVQAMDALVRRVEPMVKQRAQLSQTIDSATALGEMLAQRARPLQVLDLLTQALPDDTSLLGVVMDGNKVTINGLTGNAAALMQELGSRPEFRDVKAPSPATRPLGSNKDLFTIEFMLALPAAGQAAAAVSPATGPVATAPAPGAAAGAGAQPAPGAPAAPGPAPTAAAPAPAAPPAPAPAPRPPGGPSFGGATFGAPAKAP